MKRTLWVFAMMAFSNSAIAQSRQNRPVVGYLTGLNRQQLLQLSELPPQDGDTRDITDRAVFKATRLFENSPRWKLAQSDADLTTQGVLNAFSCSLGIMPAPKKVPELYLLLDRAIADANAIAGKIKNEYQRKRPFLVDPGPTCVPTEGYLANSFDFPSGHATSGWVAGLVLAELFPSQETTILARARQYGESRAFCGVHNISAVEAARTVGSGVVAMLHGSEEFRKNLKSARAEIKHTGLTNASPANTCSADAATLAVSPYRATVP